MSQLQRTKESPALDEIFDQRLSQQEEILSPVRGKSSSSSKEKTEADAGLQSKSAKKTRHDTASKRPRDQSPNGNKGKPVKKAKAPGLSHSPGNVQPAENSSTPKKQTAAQNLVDLLSNENTNTTATGTLGSVKSGLHPNKPVDIDGNNSSTARVKSSEARDEKVADKIDSNDVGPKKVTAKKERKPASGTKKKTGPTSDRKTAGGIRKNQIKPAREPKGNKKPVKPVKPVKPPKRTGIRFVLADFDIQEGTGDEAHEVNLAPQGRLAQIEYDENKWSEHFEEDHEAAVQSFVESNGILQKMLKEDREEARRKEEYKDNEENIAQGGFDGARYTVHFVEKNMAMAMEWKAFVKSTRKDPKKLAMMKQHREWLESRMEMLERRPDFYFIKLLGGVSKVVYKHR